MKEREREREGERERERLGMCKVIGLGMYCSNESLLLLAIEFQLTTSLLVF